MSELKTNKISPAVGTGVTLGDDGDTFTIPAGATIVNSGTATGFGGLSGLIKLASTTISTPVAAVAFNSTYINSTYDNYKVVFSGMAPSVDNSDIGLLMSVDNGSSFATHVGGSISTLVTGSTTTGTNGNFGYIPIAADQESDSTGNTSGFLDIFNVNSTTQYKFANGLNMVKNHTGVYYGFQNFGYIASNTAVNYIKVYISIGGNLAIGTVTLYGYAK